MGVKAFCQVLMILVHLLLGNNLISSSQVAAMVDAKILHLLHVKPDATWTKDIEGHHAWESDLGGTPKKTP